MSNEPDDLLPGTVLQRRYVIQYRAGGGGMGTVYNAIDEHIAGRVVAVKEMKQVDQNGKKLVGEALEKARKRFKREAVLLSSLQHDHIPRVYDSFESQEHSYLVMEWIDGETLQERLKNMRGAMPVELVLAYALQLCDALFYLHNHHNGFHPIIFRDLKPSNIMVRPDGHVFLIDFGIARIFKPGQKDDTENFRVQGFGAPELGFLQTDERTDVFSLGATMHYCLTGQFPDYFLDNKPFPSIKHYNSNIPIELDALILNMVQYHPDDRPHDVGEIKQRFEQISRDVVASHVGVSQTSTLSSQLFDPSFYSDKTESASNVPSRTHHLAPVQQRFIPQFPPTTPAKVSLLEIVLDGLASGWRRMVRPLAIRTRRAGKAIFSTGVRQSAYYRYLSIQARLNASGVWTTRFLLFLVGMLIVSIALATFVYARAGQSFYRAELALAFMLLVVAVVAGGRLRSLTARHLMLGAGCLIGVAFLALLVSSGFQDNPQGAGIPGQTGQATILNLLLTYGVVTLALIALIGSAGSKTSSTQSQTFARSGRVAMAGVAGICFLLQNSFGEMEQVLFLPSNERPFAVTLVSSPHISTNVFALAVLGFVAIFSLMNISQPFGRFTRFLLVVLCAAFLLVQLTFGYNRLGLVFPQISSTTLLLLNTGVFLAPLLLALLTFWAIPERMAWVAYLPLLALSLGVAFMQTSLGNSEPYAFLSSQPQMQGDGFDHLAAPAQVLVFCLIAAGTVLFFRAVLATRRSGTNNYSVTQNATIAIRAIKLPGAGDRLALAVVALGCGVVQLAFWSGIAQHVLPFELTQQDSTLLYAPYLGLIFTTITMAAAALAVLFVLAHALFFPERNYSWVKGLLIAFDSVTILCLAIITLELLFIFGARGGWLASSFDTAKVFGSATPDFTVSYSLLAMGLIAILLFIVFFLLKRPFGWMQRMLVLFCCVATIVILTDTHDVQALPLFSANVQQVTGTFSSLSINHLVAVCLLLSSLLSLLWLLRARLVSDRIVLGSIFLLAALFASLHILTSHHVLFMIALLLEIQGLLIAFKIDRVRNGI